MLGGGCVLPGGGHGLAGGSGGEERSNKVTRKVVHVGRPLDEERLKEIRQNGGQFRILSHVLSVGLL